MPGHGAEREDGATWENNPPTSKVARNNLVQKLNHFLLR
jgi:hypothetical protein